MKSSVTDKLTSVRCKSMRDWVTQKETLREDSGHRQLSLALNHK